MFFSSQNYLEKHNLRSGLAYANKKSLHAIFFLEINGMNKNFVLIFQTESIINFSEKNFL